jgi:chromosome segregation ATPase
MTINNNSKSALTIDEKLDLLLENQEYNQSECYSQLEDIRDYVKTLNDTIEDLKDLIQTIQEKTDEVRISINGDDYNAY